MKTYNLFLDESGQFIENKNRTGRPAIVAGYMVENSQKDFKPWAGELLKKTKESKKNFKNIDIERFHAMEDTSPEMSDFITCLIKKMSEDNVSLVSFNNALGEYVVDSDITYLNVFADGIVQLIRHLLSKTADSIHLRITYAHRIFVKKQDFSSVPIPSREYTERIKERIVLRLNKLPKEETNRLIFDLDRSEDFNGNDAKYFTPLMIADAVCAAFRGKRDSLTDTQTRIIDSVPCFTFSVLENETWNLIQELIAENRLADAIYTWSMHSGKLTESQKNFDFYNLLIDRLKSMNLVGVNSQFQALSKLIGAFVDRSLVARHETIKANIVIKPILVELFPRLEKAGFDILRPKFDLWFYRLTTATHDGDTAKENEAINECNALEEQINWTFEDMSYQLSYYIRKVEHYKNIFDFKHAETELIEFGEIVKQTMSGFASLTRNKSEKLTGRKSVTIGKLYGSLVGAQSYMIQEPSLIEKEIRTYSDEAIGNFTEEKDILRQYQIRSQAEYSLGYYSEALNWLKKSAKLKKENGVSELLNTFVEKGDSFGLMHFGKIMEKACLDGFLDLGNELYRQWNGQRANTIIDSNEAAYPVYVIYGSLGTTRALLKIGISGKKNAALKSFEKAIEKAEAKSENFTCYAAGLSYEAKALALAIKKEDERKTARNNLLTHLNNFLNNEQVPPTIKQVFTGWQDLFHNEEIDTDSEGYRNEILQKALQVPIL